MLWCSPQRVCNGGANRDRPKCEPVPDHTQDLSCIVVRAYKRSCEHVDPVIKIGYQSDSIGGKGGTRTLDPGIMSAGPKDRALAA